MSALTGARIINTRARRQAAELDAALRARGAEPVAFPCIEIAPPDDDAPLRAAMNRLSTGEYDWLVLTSANAVSALAPALGSRAQLTRVRIAAVGPGTAAALVEEFGVSPDVIPAKHDAASLLSALPALAGKRVFVPCSSLARPELVDGLRAMGADVDAVMAYRTVVGAGGADVASMIAAGEIDAIAFASPSAVDGLLTRLDGSSAPLPLVQGLPVGCIGATTADHAARRGFNLISIANRQTVPGLVDSLAAALASTRKGAAA